MTDPEKSPYSEGYEAAAIPPPDQPNCPYPKDDPRADKWWEGFGDATEDLIRYNGGEDEPY